MTKRSERLNLHLSEADKQWLEDHVISVRRKTRSHLTLADAVADAIAIYRELINTGELDPNYPI